MQVLEVLAKDLFNQPDFKGLNRQEMWERATFLGWKFSNVSGNFHMKVIKLNTSKE